MLQILIRPKTHTNHSGTLKIHNSRVLFPTCSVITLSSFVMQLALAIQNVYQGQFWSSRKMELKRKFIWCNLFHKLLFILQFYRTQKLCDSKQNVKDLNISTSLMSSVHWLHLLKYNIGYRHYTQSLRINKTFQDQDAQANNLHF